MTGGNVSELYRKTMQGKRVQYVPYVPPEETITKVTFTEGQCLTAAGALGLTLMMVFERNIAPHKKVARKIKAVEDAIAELYRDTGQPIDREIATLMCDTWDRVMTELSA